jgi:hypothetical protein
MAAALAAGCGNVASLPADAPVDSLLDALTCEAPKLTCGGACFDPMTSDQHCGDCDTTCAASTTCVAGHCADNVNTSCAKLHAHDSTLVDGMYTLIDNNNVYCDMTDGGIQYSSLAFDNYNATPPTGYTLVTTTDYQTAATQKAFIAVYNAQFGSLPLLANPMTITSCCIKASTTANKGLYMGDMGNPVSVEPASVGSTGPLSCIASYTTALSFGIASGTPVYAGNPMSAAWFTAHPMVEGPCGDGNNPGLFWKKVMP